VFEDPARRAISSVSSSGQATSGSGAVTNGTTSASITADISR
jgi:hypothetical protein